MYTQSLKLSFFDTPLFEISSLTLLWLWLTQTVSSGSSAERLWVFVNFVAFHHDVTVACPQPNTLETGNSPSAGASLKVSIPLQNLPTFVHFPEPLGSWLYFVQSL